MSNTTNEQNILISVIKSEEVFLYNTSFINNSFNNAIFIESASKFLILKLCNIWSNEFNQESYFLKTSSYMLIEESQIQNNSFDRGF